LKNPFLQDFIDGGSPARPALTKAFFMRNSVVQESLLQVPTTRRKGEIAIFFRRGGGTPQKGNALSVCVTAFTPCPFWATADYISPLGLESSPERRLRATARAVFSAFLPTFPRSPRL